MPAEKKTERVPIVMSPSELRVIDDWSFANRIRSRSEAIRRLLECGLGASELLDAVEKLRVFLRHQPPTGAPAQAALAEVDRLLRQHGRTVPAPL